MKSKFERKKEKKDSEWPIIENGRELYGSRPFVITCHWTMGEFADKIKLYFCILIH